MKRTGVLLLGVLLLAGCTHTMVPLTPEGRAVKVVGGDLTAVQGCTPLHQFRTTSVMDGLFSEQGHLNNRYELMNETARVGGDTLVLMDTSADYWRLGMPPPTATGTAYRCGSAPRP